MNEKKAEAAFDWEPLRKEDQAIRLAIGDATIAWSILENNLLNIFNALAFQAFGSPVGGVVFYTLSNSSTQIQLVCNLLEFWFDKGARNEIDKATRDKVYARWKKIIGRIKAEQKTRNMITHGSHMSQGNVRRIAPHILDTLRVRKAKPGLRGIGLNDMHEFVSSVTHTIRMLNILSLIIEDVTQTRVNRGGIAIKPLRLRFEEMDALINAPPQDVTTSHTNP